MKQILSKIIFKIQQLATFKLYDLYFWIIISGAISTMLVNYLIHQHIVSFYSGIVITLFIYYSGYKLILE